MAQYGIKSYWEQRYAKDVEPFDWYQRYEGLRELITQYVKKHEEVLVTGCGNSRLTESMYKEGFKSIVNVDFCKPVIDRMREAFPPDEYRGLEWETMDVMDMSTFGDDKFNAIVDKGTLDSVLCGENSTANVAKYCKEASRVLQPDGIFFVVSYGTPENRLSYLEQDEYGWNVTVHTVRM